MKINMIKYKPIFENNSLMIWKMVIASSLSWEVAKLLGSHHPYLAPLTVILCVKSMVDQTITFAKNRFIGTVLGSLLIIPVYKYIDVNALTIGLLILVSCFISKWLRLDSIVIEQVALTILLVAVLEQQAGSYVFDRIRDTLVGAIFAIVINIYLFPSTYVKRMEKIYDKYQGELSTLFLHCSDWIKGGCNPENGKQMQQQLQRVSQKLLHINEDSKKISAVFHYFPLCIKKAKMLTEYAQKMDALRNGCTYLLTVTETFKEWGRSGKLNENDKIAWSKQMEIFSKHVEDFHDHSANSLYTNVVEGQQNQSYSFILIQATKRFMNSN
ncbi:FUSC family protein [Heyndrickxia ginsengihumi]|nr:FUSC family protein [Heyndrickxia ginsengihumi]MBE6185297.1 FUSC family protein [Bacillus sp. (in: firmicutes)]